MTKRKIKRTTAGKFTPDHADFDAEPVSELAPRAPDENDHDDRAERAERADLDGFLFPGHHEGWGSGWTGPED